MVNHHLSFPPGITVCKFLKIKTKSISECQTGNLKGNHFSIILRGFSLEQIPDVENKIRIWSESGFKNFYGVQRFTPGGYPLSFYFQRQYIENIKTHGKISEKFYKKLVLKILDELYISNRSKISAFYKIYRDNIENGTKLEWSSNKKLKLDWYYKFSFHDNIYKYVSSYLSRFDIKTDPELYKNLYKCIQEGHGGEKMVKFEKSSFTSFCYNHLLKNDKLEEATALSELTCLFDQDPKLEKILRENYLKFILDRKSIVIPQNVNFKWHHHSNPFDNLQFNEMEKLSGYPELTYQAGNYTSLQIKFDLPKGCYATVAIGQLFQNSNLYNPTYYKNNFLEFTK